MTTLFPTVLAQLAPFRAGKQSKAFSAFPAVLQGNSPTQRLSEPYRCFRHKAAKPYFPAHGAVLA
jgi:hypothetical protein